MSTKGQSDKIMSSSFGTLSAMCITHRLVALLTLRATIIIPRPVIEALQGLHAALAPLLVWLLTSIALPSDGTLPIK